MNILIADDEQEVTQRLKASLDKKGYAVDICFDGRAALKMIKAKQYDIIFVDHNMPEMTGLEVAKYVRENKLKPKVVMLTGYTAMDQFFAELVGVDEYREKPIEISEIEEIIKKYFPKTA